MKYLIIVLLAIPVLTSCQSEEEKTKAKADAMVAEALAKAEKLQQEAETKAAAKIKEVEAEVARKQAAAEQAKLQAIESEKAAAKQARAALQHSPNKALSKYNGFYLGQNQNGALIFVDGKLVYFDCSRFKTVYKNEEYNVRGITAGNEMDIKAQYFKNRKGEVQVKAANLQEVTPTVENGVCTKLVRRGKRFDRWTNFRAFIKTKDYYPMASFLKDFKAKYNRTDAEIEKGMTNPNFYKADFFQKAPFYGDHMPLVDALESIIKM